VREDRARDGGAVRPRFDLHLGITTRSEAPGSCVAELTLAAEHRNIEGSVHGGVFLTLLDTAMGHAVATLHDRERLAGAATIQFSCQFLRPPAGSKVAAVGTVVRVGRTSAFVDGVLRDDAGSEVARAHGVWRIWREAGERTEPAPD
jgi:uncharacterized protein (TIGR00369 family)